VRAVNLLHLGTRLGCEGCAGDLGAIFRSGDVPGGVRDPDRADRYQVLGNALYYNRDLRFPNLDKILPLPPAPLPKWDGDKKTLIDAAKGVVPIPPKPPASAASQRTGRAHMPDRHALPIEPQQSSAARYESTNAGLDGYWLPQLSHPSSPRHEAWNAAQVPLRYAAHETFEPARDGLDDADGRVVFHYLGVPIPVHVANALEHPAGARGIARAVEMPAPYITADGRARASRSGIWLARLPNEHPRAATFNHWLRQRYLTQGEPFPTLTDAPAVERGELTWYCCGQSNEERSEGWSFVRLNETDTFGG